jgi:hypothetical protein
VPFAAALVIAFVIAHFRTRRARARSINSSPSTRRPTARLRQASRLPRRA